MPDWTYRVALKHLYTKREDLEGIQASMTAIAEVLNNDPYFQSFDTSGFNTIPLGDDVFKPVDYANRLLNRMYDYADLHRIWIN